MCWSWIRPPDPPPAPGPVKAVGLSDDDVASASRDFRRGVPSAPHPSVRSGHTVVPEARGRKVPSSGGSFTAGGGHPRTWGPRGPCDPPPGRPFGRSGLGSRKGASSLLGGLRQEGGGWEGQRRVGPSSAETPSPPGTTRAPMGWVIPGSASPVSGLRVRAGPRGDQGTAPNTELQRPPPRKLCPRTPKVGFSRQGPYWGGRAGRHRGSDSAAGAAPGRRLCPVEGPELPEHSGAGGETRGSSGDAGGRVPAPPGATRHSGRSCGPRGGSGVRAGTRRDRGTAPRSAASPETPSRPGPRPTAGAGASGPAGWRRT